MPTEDNSALHGNIPYRKVWPNEYRQAASLIPVSDPDSQLEQNTGNRYKDFVAFLRPSRLQYCRYHKLYHDRLMSQTFQFTRLKKSNEMQQYADIYLLLNYQRLQLQFYVLLMMGAMDDRNM